MASTIPFLISLSGFFSLLYRSSSWQPKEFQSLVGLPPIRDTTPTVFSGPSDVIERDSDDEADNTPMGGEGISSSQHVLVPSEDERREEGGEERVRG